MRKPRIPAAPSAAVERLADRICREGCSRVNEYIERLRSGRTVPGVDRLDLEERQALLEELVSVMSVYECRCDDG